MIHKLILTPRDPLVARDGRPFGAGQGTRMRSLDWFYPSVVAGSLRTMLGKESNLGFQDQATLDALKRTAVAGPFPVIDGNLYLPRPGDLVIREEAGQRTAFGVRPVPLADGAGCDLPKGLSPVMLPDSCGDDFKPVKGPAFWSLPKLAEWLSHASGEGFVLPAVASTDSGGLHDAERRATNGSRDADFLGGPEREERTHVRIEASSGAAEESQLFTTVALDMSRGRSGDAICMSLRVEPDPFFEPTTGSLNALHPCGGERRLVHWKVDRAVSWEMPESLIEAIDQSARSSPQRVRLTLVTPALFREQESRGLSQSSTTRSVVPHLPHLPHANHEAQENYEARGDHELDAAHGVHETGGLDDGWKPGWLRDKGTHFEGSPPGCSVTLKLVGAVVERWRPVSGWSLESPVGPKPVRRLVPAGATYFFEVVSGTISGREVAEKLWLRSICDEPQDRHDGFGLGVWGIW